MNYVNFRKDVVTSVIDTGSKLSLCVEDTDAVVMATFADGVVDTGGAPLVANIFWEFSEIPKGSWGITRGLQVNIYQKAWNYILWHCPLQ